VTSPLSFPARVRARAARAAGVCVPPLCFRPKMSAALFAFGGSSSSRPLPPSVDTYEMAPPNRPAARVGRPTSHPPLKRLIFDCAAPHTTHSAPAQKKRGRAAFFPYILRRALSLFPHAPPSFAGPAKTRYCGLSCANLCLLFRPAAAALRIVRARAQNPLIRTHGTHRGVGPSGTSQMCVPPFSTLLLLKNKSQRARRDVCFWQRPLPFAPSKKTPHNL
jgi:hypothetical protein